MLPYLLILQVKILFKKAWDLEEEGQTLVEYALALAIIAVVTIGALLLLGVTLGDSYGTIAQAIPDMNIFSNPISLGHMSNDQGNIQWFLIDN